MSDPAGDVSLLDDLDLLLMELAGALDPQPPRSGPGRPPILAHAIIWTALVLGVLRGCTSQLGVWRQITRRLWPGYGPVQVSDQAVYKKLGATGPSPMGQLFGQMTDLLIERVAPWQDDRLAPFATEVVAIDETALDQVPRTLADLWGLPKGDRRLLPGKLACRFDLRRQLFGAVQVITDPRQNEKIAAWDLVADLAPGSLIVADLGYFGFRWFDTLTERGLWWLSRERSKSSTVPVHTFYRSDHLVDELVWLGAYRADRAKHLIRRITVVRPNGRFVYYTNVTDPRLASARDLVHLYGRRWDIELAFKLVKRDLKLTHLWSAKPAVIEHQLWAVVLIAQLLSALRLEIAGRADVPIDDVSMPLMVQYLPEYARSHPDDPIGAFVADGVFLRFIRPASRTRYEVETVAAADYHLPPPDLITTRSPRYAGKV
jgi:hypothetical protein